MSSPKTLLRRLGLRPDKARGQHFLQHPHQARRVAEALELTPADTVVEIGPGLGALTTFLAQAAGRVVAVEVDPLLAAYLREELFSGHPRVEIRCQDILAFPFPQLAREVAAPVAVAGNLPYQITSPLLFKLAGEKTAVSRAVLMMQQEVGERLTAPPGGKEYGILSVLLQYHFVLERLFTLGPGNFYPSPQVTSVVVRLTPHPPPLPARDESFLARVVKLAFSQRRKTLRNTLALQAPLLGLAPEAVLAALNALDLDPGRRAETLSVTDFVNLANELGGKGRGP
uniref:Ribosomal RNA small subunit methyltransferase A n=1 Tax=Desulfobacca acetoxidans TaxID=60893 RepID=A0A7V4G738_9BACT